MIADDELTGESVPQLFDDVTIPVARSTSFDALDEEEEGAIATQFDEDEDGDEDWEVVEEEPFVSDIVDTIPVVPHSKRSALSRQQPAVSDNGNGRNSEGQYAQQLLEWNKGLLEQSNGQLSCEGDAAQLGMTLQVGDRQATSGFCTLWVTPPSRRNFR